MKREVKSELVGAVAGELTLIPAGTYLAGFHRIETAMMFGRQAKVVLRFRIADGEYMGVDVNRYYNAQQLLGKPGPRGKFRVGRSSDYLFDLVRLHGPPPRFDRLPTRVWNGVYTIRVRTVTQRSGGERLPEALRYSVVDKILKKVAGAS